MIRLPGRHSDSILQKFRKMRLSKRRYFPVTRRKRHPWLMAQEHCMKLKHPGVKIP